ncbi:GxxExxY protein [Thermodesulfobacteriota bacterium]
MKKEDEAKLVNYLNAAKKEIGFLINFSPKGIEVKRKLRWKRKSYSLMMMKNSRTCSRST